jgi:hypothetical protein
MFVKNALSGLVALACFFVPVLTFPNEGLSGSNAAALVVMASIIGGLVIAGLIQRYL